MVTVETGARLHFGFQNLSLAHERLYGGVGVALDEPRIVVDVERATDVLCDDDEATPYVRNAVEVLGVDGAEVTVRERFGRHVGLGSGTQLALACLVGMAEAYGVTVDPRESAPALGRGGQSGIGVATFEAGGFVVEAGHPTERFTTQPPDRGSWEVPRPIFRQSLPDSWRFVLVTPGAETGRSGVAEAESMESVVENADPGIADEIASVLTHRLLPGIVEADLDAFGSSISRLGRLNGAWYADEQGGVYRPPAGRLVEALDSGDAIAGVGQSSWGPTVYGVTTAGSTDQAVETAEAVLERTGIDGTVRLVSPRNTGATVRP